MGRQNNSQKDTLPYFHTFIVAQAFTIYNQKHVIQGRKIYPPLFDSLIL